MSGGARHVAIDLAACGGISRNCLTGSHRVAPRHGARESSDAVAGVREDRVDCGGAEGDPSESATAAFRA
jgi:hypothetical protein